MQFSNNDTRREKQRKEKKGEKKRKIRETSTPIYFSIFTYPESTSIKISNGGKTHHTVKNNPQDKLICEVTNHSALQTPTCWLLPFSALLHSFFFRQKVTLTLLPYSGDRLTLCSGQPRYVPNSSCHILYLHKTNRKLVRMKKPKSFTFKPWP